MPRGKNIIEYPPDCKQVDEDLSKDELVRRLKTLARAFQDMGQDDGNVRYAPLALHLASEFFMDHTSKDVRLLTACCVADVFRCFAPEAPYKDPEQLKEIFLFIIKQLRGLEDIEGPSYKRYFYLLENLAWVKSFNICLELEDNQDIFCQLYKLMFEIVSEKHQGKVRNFMLDMMCPLINEGDTVSKKLLDTILINLIDPYKNDNKEAYSLAKDLIRRTSNAIEPHIQQFFNNALVLGKTSESEMSGHIYHLIYELNQISPSVLLAVLPQLEFKLKSNDEKERRAATRLLAKMFSNAESDLAEQNHALWMSYLGRYNDIDMNVRTTCVQYSQHFLINHPSLIKDIAENLKHRAHDSEESVRHEVIMAVVNAARKDLGYVNDDLLSIVKERTLDKKTKVRREALLGLGQIYKQYTMKENVIKEDLEQLRWIKDKVLHAYYHTSIEDRVIVERILNTCLVPYQLETKERMKKLFELYGTLDEYASKAFHELLRTQTMLRRHVTDLIELHNKEQTPEVHQQRLHKCLQIARTHSDPLKVLDSYKKFNSILEKDERIRKHLATLVSPNCSCKEAESTVKEIIKKLGNPTQQNLLYTNTKTLLERVAPLLFDKISVEALVKYVDEAVQGMPTISEEVTNPEESGMKLLLEICVPFPGAFNSEEVFSYMMGFLKHEDDQVCEIALQMFTITGSNLQENQPNVYSSLLPVLQKTAKMGTPKQAKHAIRCIEAVCKNKETIFTQIFEHLNTNSLDFDSANLMTALTSLGHIAELRPEEFGTPMKTVVSKFVVKEILMQDRESSRKSSESWCDDLKVSKETKAKTQSMKLMVKWLRGLKSNASGSATSTMRLLHTMLIHEGDLMERGKISKPEKARLRLAAGCCVLKLAEETAYQDAITLEHFQALALLMNDSCFQVRLKFAQKLNKGLISMRLPLKYMSALALAANDPVKERRTEVKSFVAKNISKRRDYIKTKPINGTAMMMQILPDYVLPYTVHLLAHDPDLKSHSNVEALKNIKECLWFIMEPFSKDDQFNYTFYRKIFENIKQTKDSQGITDENDSDDMNKKLYAVCDIGLGLLQTKLTNITLKDQAAEPVLPQALFTQPDRHKINSTVYLPKELIFTPPKKRGAANILSTPKAPPIKSIIAIANDIKVKTELKASPAPVKKGVGASNNNDKTPVVKDRTNKQTVTKVKSTKTAAGLKKDTKKQSYKNTLDKYLKKENRATSTKAKNSISSPTKSNSQSSSSSSPEKRSNQKSSTSSSASSSPLKNSRKSAPVKRGTKVTSPSTPNKGVSKTGKNIANSKKISDNVKSKKTSNLRNQKSPGKRANAKPSPVKKGKNVVSKKQTLASPSKRKNTRVTSLSPRKRAAIVETESSPSPVRKTKLRENDRSPAKKAKLAPVKNKRQAIKNLSSDFNSEDSSSSIRSTPRKRPAARPLARASNAKRAKKSKDSQESSSSDIPSTTSSRSTPKKTARSPVKKSPQKAVSPQKNINQKSNVRRNVRKAPLVNGTSDGEDSQLSYQSSTRSPRKRAAAVAKAIESVDVEDEVNIKRKSRASRRR